MSDAEKAAAVEKGNNINKMLHFLQKAEKLKNTDSKSCASVCSGCGNSWTQSSLPKRSFKCAEWKDGSYRIIHRVAKDGMMNVSCGPLVFPSDTKDSTIRGPLGAGESFWGKQYHRKNDNVVAALVSLAVDPLKEILLVHPELLVKSIEKRRGAQNRVDRRIDGYAERLRAVGLGSWLKDQNRPRSAGDA